MNDALQLIAAHGLAFVFANIFVERLGVPVPGVPTLIVAGALAAQGKISVTDVFAVTLVACVVADGIWYAAGRRYGLGVLRLLCKVSLSPDSCVRQTENQFERWGALSLVFGKFIPGVATVASPLAGAMNVGWKRFMLFNTLGSVLWASVAIGVGMALHRQIAALIDRFEKLGILALQIVVAALLAFVAFKWWERHRFRRKMRLARISVGDLRKRMEEGNEPVIVDVRSRAVRQLDPRFIPGARAMDFAELDARSGELPRDHEIVFYCECPNEASAVVAAKRLIDLGYPRVRPLHGGLEEWIAAGYEIERR